MSNTYLLGNIVQLSSTFTDINGNLINPTTVTVSVKTPLATIDTPAASTSSTGIYTATYTPLYAGIYFYLFNGTGAATAAAQGQFNVIDPEA